VSQNKEEGEMKKYIVVGENWEYKPAPIVLGQAMKLAKSLLRLSIKSGGPVLSVRISRVADTTRKDSK
jgi:hypothetical protein